MVTMKLLDKLHEDLQEGESLLICCRSFSSACENHYPNIEIKKIPQMLLGRCEFGKEDYSLNIVNVPLENSEDEAREIEIEEESEVKSSPPKTQQMNMF